MPPHAHEIPNILDSLLDSARRAREMLEDDAARQIVDFLLGQSATDGGFVGPGGSADLYYTFFGLLALEALGAAYPAEGHANYIERFSGCQDLDLVHTACCLCSLALVSRRRNVTPEGSLAGALGRFRQTDGSYADPDHPGANVYHSFLAVTAHDALGADLEDPEGLFASLEHLRTDDGGFANEPTMTVSTTTASAAAAVLGMRLAGDADRRLNESIRNRFVETGGFKAAPNAPVPDLLSTATAVFALDATGRLERRLREPSLSFVDGLWSASGGFAGSPLDSTADCEYTFYGLLALGCLA